jgi:hypothetical protein
VIRWKESVAILQMKSYGASMIAWTRPFLLPRRRRASV